MNLFGTFRRAKYYEQLAKQAEFLVPTAQIFSSSLYEPVAVSTPGFRDKILYSNWNYFVTVGCIFLATQRLACSDVKTEVIDKLISIIQIKAKSWNNNSWDDFTLCTNYWHAECERIVSLESSLQFAGQGIIGRWVCQNLISKNSNSDLECKMANIIGSAMVLNFTNNYWNFK